MNTKTKSTTIPEHLFVTNPYTGRVINILPLFACMNENFATSSDGPGEVIARLQKVHDFVSTRMPCLPGDHIDPKEWVETNWIIIQLRKAFDDMNEFRP